MRDCHLATVVKPPPPPPPSSPIYLKEEGERASQPEGFRLVAAMDDAIIRTFAPSNCNHRTSRRTHARFIQERGRRLGVHGLHQ